MGKKTGDIRRAEKLIQKKERQTKKAKRPACCGSCEYNQPNFKYRTCLFVRCPKDKTRRTLRDKPLRKDKFSAYRKNGGPFGKERRGLFDEPATE